ncbi:hypothetical protein [Haloarcula salinisoli]|uniref:Uncharacterized protein n=1 Tax=Haloarcula salinisoli TaxID=2487746 RepID=A0A8J7YI02_9EURY|nr:hypothetical protein [Halomicroarcula salinisoli]MBX0285138.1 hypothetical protein [Halomicroarcula salinisoli]MBX0303384.1 hypothetical protein [Halomicroarcula salinisoli]
MLFQLLQVPGMGTLFIFILLGILVLFVVSIGVSYWVYSDAKKRGNDTATIWAIMNFLGMFMLGFTFLPLCVVVPIVYLVAGRE